MQSNLSALLVSLLLLTACAEQRAPAAKISLDAAAPSPDHARGCESHTVSPVGVGSLRLGISVDSLRHICRVIRDTVALTKYGEVPARTVGVSFTPDTVWAGVGDDGRVFNVQVRGGAFAVADSLRVGTPLGTLTSVAGIVGEVSDGELFVVLPSQCGMSFGISADSTFHPDTSLSVEQLRRLPASSRVTSIWIAGCRATAT
jgi:hypothetical protein